MKLSNLKRIVFLCGALLSAPLISMELAEQNKDRTLWPCQLTPLVVEAICKEYKMLGTFYTPFLSSDCPRLACVNKELSEDVPYEWLCLAGRSGCFISPLEHVLQERMLYGFNKLKQERYLTIAKRLLSDGEHKLNKRLMRMNGTKVTLLQQAAYNQDKELCRLFLEKGADPFKQTECQKSAGLCLYWNAFHFAERNFASARRLSMPQGWLLEMWKEVEKHNNNEIV